MLSNEDRSAMENLMTERIAQAMAQYMPSSKPGVRTVADVLRETLQAINTKDVPPEDKHVLDSIDVIIEELKGKGVTCKEFGEYSADELSRLQGSLALYKEDLGSLLSRAERNAKASAWMLDVRRARCRALVIEELTVRNPKRKPTVDDIEAELEEKTFKDMSIKLFREEYSARCTYLWRTVNSLLDTLKVRINVLMSDRSTSSMASDNAGLLNDSTGIDMRELEP